MRLRDKFWALALIRSFQVKLWRVETAEKAKDEACSFIVRHLPSRIVYWSVIHAAAVRSVEHPEDEITEFTVLELIEGRV